MNAKPAPRVLLLPGLWNSGPDHWQSHWEQAYPEFTRVQQDDWETPKRDDWVARLHAAIRASDAPAILVAHSLGCNLVSQWAMRHDGPVAGALLVAPSDVDAPTYPTGMTGFMPMPLARLPFRAIVAASTDDEYVSVERARFFAARWGAECVMMGAHGHLNSASKLGMWPAGMALLERLRAAA